MTTNLEETIKEILADIADLKGDLRLHAFPDLYGIKHIIKKGFNGTFKKIDLLESKRKRLSDLCQKEGIDYGYEEKEIYLKKFINLNPWDAPSIEDKILNAALKVGAYVETFIYLKEYEKDLYKISNYRK